MEQDGQFLRYVVESLVDNPHKVEVKRTVDQMGVLLTLTVDPADMGKIIGRSGATAKAIRTILRVVGMKHEARVNLKIEEPEGSTHQRRETPAYDRGIDGIDDVIQDLKDGQ